MTTKRKIAASRIEIPTSSMADIAFLLLVFFLVCTVIDLDKGLKLVLPGEEPVTVSPEKIIHLLINSENEILIDGDRINITDVDVTIKEKMRATEDLIVSLKPSRKATYQSFITVLDQLKSIDARRISIADPD